MMLVRDPAHAMQVLTVLSASLVVGWATRRFVPTLPKPVYLIDTYTYKPPDRMKCSRENYIRGARMRKVHYCPSFPAPSLAHACMHACNDSGRHYQHNCHNMYLSCMHAWLLTSLQTGVLCRSGARRRCSSRRSCSTAPAWATRPTSPTVRPSCIAHFWQPL